MPGAIVTDCAGESNPRGDLVNDYLLQCNITRGEVVRHPPKCPQQELTGRRGEKEAVISSEAKVSEHRKGIHHVVFARPGADVVDHERKPARADPVADDADVVGGGPR